MDLLTLLVVFAALAWLVLASPWAPELPLKLEKAKEYLEYVRNPRFLFYLVAFKLNASKLPRVPTGLDDDAAYCYRKLTKVSRSFSTVILALDDSLRDAVMLFYLVLRALDTIEDDMAPPVATKVALCTDFYKHILDPAHKHPHYGKDEEKDLLVHFDRCARSLNKLCKKEHRDTIVDITRRMGAGMASFLERDVETIKDYEEYCHYVAGLVGIGLSRLFADSGIEDPAFAQREELSNSMGLFLQKVNITRDYLEDILEQPPRIFYPREIWGHYAGAVDELRLVTPTRPPLFKDAPRVAAAPRAHALACLNHMVCDALKHAPDCIEYLSLLRNPSVFAFCAIPQVMAISTLNKCYNNRNVFRWTVKISKGEAVENILNANSFASVLSFFDAYADRLLAKVDANANDPSAAETRRRLLALKKRVAAERAKQ